MEIPFHKGKFVNYVERHMKDDIEWRSNYEFDTIMTLDSINRGRSAANFTVTDSDGNSYIMFMKDLFDACQNSVISKGEIAGKFTFCKRGTNYGVKLVKR